MLSQENIWTENEVSEKLNTFYTIYNIPKYSNFCFSYFTPGINVEKI